MAGKPPSSTLTPRHAGNASKTSSGRRLKTSIVWMKQTKGRIDGWQSKYRALTCQPTEELRNCLPPAPPPPNIADDGIEFTRAFIRRGRGEDATHRRPSITERAKRLRTAPLERLLAPAELLDPELVDFWTDDVAQSVSLPGAQSVGAGGQSIRMGWDDSDASSQSLKPTPNRGGMIKVDCTSKRLLPACKASRAAAGNARRALHEAASASNSRSRAAFVQATDRTYGSGSPADSQQVMHASSVTVAQSLWKYDAKAQRWTWAARPQHEQHNDSGEQWWAGVEALIQRDDLLAAGSCEHHRPDNAAEFFDLDDGSV